VLLIAWRNVFRNTRRSVFTASAIAFAVLLLAFSLSMNAGQYAAMIDNGTRLLTGHAQVQARGYLDDPSLRKVVPAVSQLRAALATVPGVRNVRARAEGFALVSVQEKGFGAQVMGVEPAAERRYSSLPGMVTQGRYLGAADAEEAVIGAALARNLGARPGSELVVLGTGKEGSVAALAVTVVGIVESGIAELDRTLVQVPIDAFRPAFEFGDEASSLVLVFASADIDPQALALAATRVQAIAPGVELLPWQRLLPDMVQAIELDRLTNLLFFVLLGTMVVFSIANSFVMTVFERTREFGMLIAVGMRPGQLQRLVQLEALLVCGGGVLLGALLSLALVLLLARVGVPIPGEADAMMRRFQLPDRMYPVLDAKAILLPALLMLLATQVAAALPTLRIRWLQPVAALRGE
jgi:ABC-type lipoprotein release transport system permease subunit